jgi:hypothetical protein
MAAASDERVRLHALASIRHAQAAFDELRATEERRRGGSRRPGRWLVALMVLAAAGAAAARFLRGRGDEFEPAPDIVAAPPHAQPAPPKPEPAVPGPTGDAPAAAEPYAAGQVAVRLDEAERWRGRPVLDLDGGEIGPLQEIYFDDTTAQPEWALVALGQFRPTLRFVPLAGARFDDSGVTVPFDQAHVSDSPEVDADGHLSDEEEQALYRHYGLERPAGFRMRRPG